MRPIARALPKIALCLLPLAAGCKSDARVAQPTFAAAPPAAAAPQLASSQAQQAQQQLAARAGSLDENNQQLHAMVAQLQQQVKLHDEETTALREQLKASNDLIARVQAEKENVERKVTTMNASLKRQGSAVITANNSLRDSLPQIAVEGVTSRVDEDVIRIELPADKLFAPDSSQWVVGGAELIDRVAAEMKQAYPDQIIGVEGHTDNTPLKSTQFYNNHQLSLTRALAVFELLQTRGYFSSQQMMVVGHGGNHPVVSNATPAGRQRNRRIELVVYPDKVHR